MNPDEVVGKPAEREVWLAPDWSNYKPVTQPQPSGWTRVTIQDTTYKDGRIITRVLDESHKPITTQALDTQTDPDAKKAWDAAQATAQRQTDQAERKVKRKYPGTDPQTGQPAIVTEYEDGSFSYDASTRTTRTPTEQASDANAAELQRQRERNAALPGPNPNGATEAERRGQDPRYETDADRATRADATIKQQGADAHQQDTTIQTTEYVGKGKDRKKVTTYQSGRKVTEDAATNATPTAVTYTPDGTKVTKYDDGTETRESPAPNEDVPVTVQGPDGKPYIKHTVKGQGTAPGSIYYTDQAGNRTSFPDTAPDEPSVPGPDMPTIVLGSSQEALREYKKKLQEGVAAKLWSQKWADARWGEALQQANVAVEEAKTAENAAESTRNAEINLAGSRATLGQNAITTALDHVNKINGLLPEGSSLGGQTFAALLGIQMLMQARSGLDTVSPNARPAAVPTITAADMQNPQAMAAKRAEVQSQMPPQPNALGLGAIGNTPAPGSPAAQSAIAANEAQRQQANATAAPQAAPASVSPAAASVAAPAPSAPSLVGPTVGPSSVPPHNAATDPRLAPVPQVADPNAPVVTPTPGVTVYDPTTNPGMDEPQTGAPPEPNWNAPITKAPASDWPVLAQYQPPVAPALSDTAPQQQPAPYPAILHSEAAAKAPWQLTPTQIQQMLDAGVDEATIWSVPGRRVAA